jgi:glycosyltransferase involved in cell wall biosynthesis
MDVYADGLVTGLKAVRPEWKIIELAPKLELDKRNSSWFTGVGKYYERYWRYPLTVEKQKADIFHIIDHSDGHLVYRLKTISKSVIVTCHDLINLIYPENLYEQARLPFISMVVWKYALRGMQEADRIVAVSSNTAKDIIQNLNITLEQVTVVPDAVEPLFQLLPEAEVEFLRQQYNISPQTICLLHVGSNHPRKNVFTILKVLEALKKQGLPIHFWKTGADFTAEQKTFIRTYDLENCVTYLGKPDKCTLVQIYNAADILLSPSLYEGFGMTVLEAMACGTPVITSNVSSLPEVTGDAAVLVAPTDVPAMVKAVCRFQNDSVYRQGLSSKGLARAKLFTWEATAEQIATGYEKLVDQGRRKEIPKLG